MIRKYFLQFTYLVSVSELTIEHQEYIEIILNNNLYDVKSNYYYFTN